MHLKWQKGLPQVFTVAKLSKQKKKKEEGAGERRRPTFSAFEKQCYIY